MIFERYSELDGKHAVLSPSQCSWLNYETEDDLFKRFKSYYAAKIGTVAHDFAQELISKNMRLNKGDRKMVFFELLKNDIPRTVINLDDWYDSYSLYVNDAISFHMTPEVSLKYSDYAFGKTDAICFDNDILRIHDLKTGANPAKMDQLVCYAALFCLRYSKKPKDIETHLRIYQSNEVLTFDPEPIDICETMDTIVKFNKTLLKLGGK